MIATKWGPAIADGKFTHDASPEACRRACAASLKRLGVDSIDLWILRGVDGVTPIEDTITAMAVSNPYILFGGLSVPFITNPRVFAKS